MKRIQSIILSAILTIIFFAAITYTSCKKDPCSGVSCLNGGSCSGGSCTCPSGYTGTNCGILATTYITYNNQTFTPLVMVSATGTATVASSSSITYQGAYGDSLKVVASSTAMGGLSLTWNNISTTFPASGRTTINIQVSTEYFYFEVQNTNPSYAVVGEYVNYGTADQIFDTVNVPADNSYYGIGYYRADTGCTVKLDGSNGATETYHLTFPFTINQGLYVIYR